jgi:hypothetical protein
MEIYQILTIMRCVYMKDTKSVDLLKTRIEHSTNGRKTMLRQIGQINLTSFIHEMLNIIHHFFFIIYFVDDRIPYLLKSKRKKKNPCTGVDIHSQG